VNEDGKRLGVPYGTLLQTTTRMHMQRSHGGVEPSDSSEGESHRIVSGGSLPVLLLTEFYFKIQHLSFRYIEGHFLFFVAGT
jgi:hypothetical protein